MLSAGRNCSRNDRDNDFDLRLLRTTMKIKKKKNTIEASVIYVYFVVYTAHSCSSAILGSIVDKSRRSCLLCDHILFWMKLQSEKKQFFLQRLFQKLDCRCQSDDALRGREASFEKIAFFEWNPSKYAFLMSQLHTRWTAEFNPNRILMEMFIQIETVVLQIHTRLK